MGGNAKERQPEREPVDDTEQELYNNNKVNELGEEAFGHHSVLLDQFREVVESGCWAQAKSVKQMRVCGCSVLPAGGQTEAYLLPA